MPGWTENIQLPTEGLLPQHHPLMGEGALASAQFEFVPNGPRSNVLVLSIYTTQDNLTLTLQYPGGSGEPISLQRGQRYYRFATNPDPAIPLQFSVAGHVGNTPFPGLFIAFADWMTTSLNGVIGQWEFDSKQTVLASLPQALTIETTSICNLSCPMCNTHAFKDVVKTTRAKHLPQDIVAKLSEALPHAIEIQLHAGGEPMTSPAFWSLLDHLGPSISDSRRAISVNSNGTILDAKRVARILASNLSLVSFSMDAVTPETYRKIRGADFEQTCNNIRMLTQRRTETGSPLKVYINATLMRWNIEEIPLLPDLIKALGCDGIEMWHLNAGTAYTATDWVVNREGGTFVYADQILSKYPELSNRCISAALERARELNLDVSVNDIRQLFF